MPSSLPPDQRAPTTPATKPAFAGMTLAREASPPDPAARLAILRMQLARTPDSPRLLFKTAEACLEAGLWAEAVHHATRLATLSPNPVGMEILALALSGMGAEEALDDLWQRYRSILAARMQNRPSTGAPLSLPAPTGRIGLILAVHLIKKGHIAEGNALQASLRPCRDLARSHPWATMSGVHWVRRGSHTQPVAVIAEEGLGDQLLWAAALRELPKTSPACIVECASQLAPLLTRSFPALRVVSRQQVQGGLTLPDGYEIAMLSDLEYLLGLDAMTHRTMPWIQPDESLRARLRGNYQARFPGRRLVGLSWRSNRPAVGHQKSLRLADLATVLGQPDCAFVSLQYGDVSQEMGAAQAQGLQPPLVDEAIEATGNLDSWAAQVAAMDLVVTTSSTSAHMAGALGIPTVLVLPTRAAVFRYWGYTGNKTPWYPSVLEIVRGNEQSGPLGERVREALERALAVLPPL
jgi:hypothetical protein